MVKPEHQTRFIAGRGILRYLIGNYLNLEPQKVEFTYRDRGKPILTENNTSPPLQFNVSHSHHLGLYAFAYSHYEIGIDVELMRPVSNLISLAKRFFTEKEAIYLASLSRQKQIETFFRFWTAKEAYLKATGEGLVGLENIEVMVSSFHSQQVEVSYSNQPVTLLSLPLTENFIATVAYLGNQLIKFDSINTQQSEKMLPLLPSDACHYLQLIVTDLDR